MANEAWTSRKRSAYIGRPKVEAALDGADQWTTPSYFATSRQDPKAAGVDLSVSGNLAGVIVTLQRSLDDGVTWHDVEQYTSPTEKILTHYNHGVKLRLGIKPGDYASPPESSSASDDATGHIYVRLSQV